MSGSSKWPIGIAVAFGGFVLFFIIIFVFTKFNTVNLVEDDYYQQELDYQQQIDRVENTRTLKVPVRINYSRSKQQIQITFPAHGKAGDISGNIDFFRPSDAKLDHREALSLTPDFKQHISTVDITPGLWRLKINWVQESREFYHEDTIVIN